MIFIIPVDIRLNLFFPELRIALRPHKIPAPLMPMPEAPIHKHHGFVLRQHNIRRARQPPVILSVPQPIGKQKLPHRFLRLRILATDPRHIVTSYFRCVDVNYKTSSYIHSIITIYCSLYIFRYDFVYLNHVFHCPMA